MIQQMIKVGEDSFFPATFFEPHADQASRNLCKTISELTTRGLTWSEAAAILQDQSIRTYLFDGADQMARPLVEELYEKWRTTWVVDKTIEIS